MTTPSVDKANMFKAMRLGPVWELRSTSSPAFGSSSENSAGATLLDAPSAPSVIAVEGDLTALEERVIGCRSCSLCEARTQTVFASGCTQAPLMVVGEAPGAEEDQQGEPFVGRAGQLLDKMLAPLGQTRTHNTYIANVLKCRPPANRNPSVDEINQCKGYLLQQIQLNQPKVLLLVGKIAIQTLLNRDDVIADLRGQVHQVTVGSLQIPAVVTYHPAYLLRRPEEKRKAWDDLLLLRKHLLNVQ